MNIVYIGSSGPLSYLPLQKLISFNINVSAIVIDQTEKKIIPSICGNTETLACLAFDNNIPLVSLTMDNSHNANMVNRYLPDVILTSCYSRKVPNSILSTAKIGAYNLHPSLLPKFRGPAPLFWQFHQGVSDFGITLHRMDSKFDRGNIVAQEIISVEDGVSLQNTYEHLADIGGDLMLDFLDNVAKNKIIETSQDDRLSSYQSFPCKSDYVVDVNWEAKRLFNFINAFKGGGVYFLCEVAGRKFKIIDALYYDNKLAEEIVVLDGANIVFPCCDGRVKCKVIIE